jgi:predicted ABC-type ATPase
MNPLSSESLAIFLDRRPALVAIAGPNGAGKSTFFRSFLEASGLPFVNADVLAARLGLDAYAGASLADSIRRDMVAQGQSFVFETVFSDRSGDKLAFLKQASELGYSVVLFFIGASGPEISEGRVALRVTQGGHDVPTDKLQQRFPRIRENLKAAIPALPHIFILDNSDLRTPFRLLAHYEHGEARFLAEPVPVWLQPVLPR